MGSSTRIPSSHLKNGMLVSGPLGQQLKDKHQPTIASRNFPYTGGDVKKSGELGKMFDIVTSTTTNTVDSPAVDMPNHPPSRSSSSSQHNSGSIRSKKSSSGPLLHPTGLITSGPLTPSAHRRSDHTKALYGSAVTKLAMEDVKVGWRISRGLGWAVLVVMAMGLLVGAFLMVAIKKAVILVGVGAILVPLLLGLVWNCVWGRRGLLRFISSYPDAALRAAIDGHYVKITGVVTCGSIPLESSYQRVPRCVYVSTELYEYRGWGGKSAHPKHRFLSWGSRYSEKYIADFYISDFQSGLRALVKSGYGAKVAPFVKPATVVDVKKENRDLSPSFLRWLADRGLSSDERIMRLKEGYIKEGSTVSVMGVVRRHDNVLMIVPPQEPVSTGCQWFQCLLPSCIEGLVLTCDDNQETDVIPV